jgi:pyrroloquinoline quinone biosynthesis protein B
MLLKILGASAGGGFPQWNCHCNGCQTVRTGQAQPLTQSSIAIQASDGSWFLVNASPDVRQQIEQMRLQNCFPPVENKSRTLPFAGILLTDGEVDHTTGLMLLRESSQPLKVYSPVSVKRALTTGYPLFSTLQNYCGVEWCPLESETTIALTTGLEVEAFALSTKPPKYMLGETLASTLTSETWGIGLTFRDRINGTVITYTPGLTIIDEAVQSRFEGSDCILVDGTFWTNDELPALGVGSRTALQMGHLPLSGEDGSLKELVKLATSRKILVHINNTNPILLSNSPERQAVEAAGVQVGYDGLALQL